VPEVLEKVSSVIAKDAMEMFEAVQRY
jgi:hypothetical protein